MKRISDARILKLTKTMQQAFICFDTNLATTSKWRRQQKSQRVIVREALLNTTAKWNLHHQLGNELTVF